MPEAPIAVSPTPPLAWQARARFAFAFALTLGGCLFLLIGILSLHDRVMAPEHRFDRKVEDFRTESGSSMNLAGMDDPTALDYSLWLAGSGCAAALGVLLLLRRFSLRMLLAVALLVGLLGACPALLLQAQDYRPMRFVMGFVQPLTPAQMEQLRALLDPKAALATWPEGMREATGLSQDAILKFELHALPRSELQDPPPGIAEGTACDLAVSPDLTARQCDTLMEFYAWYMQRLGSRCAAENGQKQVGGGSFSMGGDWDRWKDAWLERNPEP